MFFKVFVFFILFSSVSFAQEPLIDLYQTQKNIGFVRTEKSRFFTEADNLFKTHFYSLIKTPSGLFAWVNGTGRLYKAVKSDTGIAFVRQDSSTHFGYNIAAFPFSYAGNIFNIGGYGLWRINGQLRVFNEKEREWDIVKLNEEVPIMFDDTNNLLWYDQARGKLYSGYSTRRDEAVISDGMDEAQNDYSVRVLDLTKNQWSRLGDLNMLLREKIQNISTIGMSPWGQLIFIGSKINLLDFAHNQLLSLNVKAPYYQLLLRNWHLNTFYFKDSTLYFGTVAGKRLDSARIKYADFDTVESKLYEPNNLFRKNRRLLVTSFAVLIVLAVLVWFFQKRYRILFQRKKSVYYVKVNNSIDKNIFEEKEILLLNALIANSEKGKYTNIDELNRLLGISKRPVEIQKKHRSDMLTSINKKFHFIYPDQPSIIQKQRSENDKRSFEYFIEFDKLLLIKEQIKSNGTKPA